MKKILLITTCFLYGFNVHSQNYSTVIQGDTSYYEYYNIYYPDWQNTQLITSSYIDSTSAITGGTQLFNYRRFDYLNFPFSSCDSGIRRSWLGDHSIQLSTGYNVFVTEKGDTVFINTQASPGSSWMYFRFPVGTYLEATVDSISEMTFVGVTDSVMYVSLQTKNQGGVNISGLFNGKGFWLSKNHGFVKTFGFRFFPDDSTYYYLAGWTGNPNGIHNLSTAEIFDFDIADEFQYHIMYRAIASEFDEYFREWHVISKVISANTDTITYEMDNTYFHIKLYNNVITTTLIHDTLPFYVVFSDLTQLNGLSEQLISDPATFFPNQHFGFTLPYEDTSYFSRDRKYIEDFYEYDITSNCYVWPLGSGIFPHRTFVKGLGEVLETDDTYMVRYDSLVYYKKGTEEWGQQLNWSVILGVDEFSSADKSVRVFPNPAGDYFDITYDGSNFEVSEFELFDMVGKSVLISEIHKGQPQRIDCKFIPNGVYFYSLTGEYGNKLAGKIVVAKE